MTGSRNDSLIGFTKRHDFDAECVQLQSSYPRLRRFQLPMPGAERIIDGNTSFIRDIYEESRIDAIDVWLGAVGEGLFEGDGDAARRAGADRQPNWNFKQSGIAKGLGITSSHGEVLGNINYAVTGYQLGMDLLSDQGLSEEVADPLVRWSVRLGGGFNQMTKDLRQVIRGLGSKVYNARRTWYGEDVADAEVIEESMDYANFLRLSKSAAKYGAHLDPAAFGFDTSSQHISPCFLLDKSQDLNQISRDLKRKIDAIFSRLEDMDEQLLRERKERERLLEEEERRGRASAEHQQSIPLGLP